VRVGELPSFPTVEEAGLAAARRAADAGPDLPRAVRGLPDREVDRLLLRVAVLAQVGVPADGPAVAVEARHGGVVGGEREEERGEGGHRRFSCREVSSIRLALYRRCASISARARSPSRARIASAMAMWASKARRRRTGSVSTASSRFALRSVRR